MGSLPGLLLHQFSVQLPVLLEGKQSLDLCGRYPSLQPHGMDAGFSLRRKKEGGPWGSMTQMPMA